MHTLSNAEIDQLNASVQSLIDDGVDGWTALTRAAKEKDFMFMTENDEGCGLFSGDGGTVVNCRIGDLRFDNQVEWYTEASDV